MESVYSLRGRDYEIPTYTGSAIDVIIAGMNILNLEQVSKTLSNRVILDNVTVGISDHDKIGVIGVNGTGKSTFLSIVAGGMEPDEGAVVMGNSVRISYLPQNPVFDETLNLVDNVAAMVNGKEEHWDTTGEVRSMLLRFGLDNPEVDVTSLSGGQKKRAALVAALLTPSDLLILDEPTNHLDHEMIEWLQNHLKSYRGALLMVTHDRYFLDEVTNQILELDRGKAYRYEENYSGYLERKQERLDAAVAQERKMATLYRKDLAWMMRGARARSTKQKAHIQRFEALRDREKIVEERNVEISALSSRLGGKTVLLDELSKSYGERVLFQDFTYHFNKKDRIGIIGPNGCGKSTLLKVLLGQIPPDHGTVEVGQTVQFGYFSQENEHLDENARVIDYVKEVAEYIPTPEGLVSASNMCERFLFDGNMQYTPIGKLSGGEKRRLYLLRVLMAAPNVLILDEPTNDLDIQTLQILEDYLDTFPGILIVVSHDRYFLDRVVTRILSFEEGGQIYQSEGGYEEYRQHKMAMGQEIRKGNTDGSMRTGTAGKGGGIDVSDGTTETNRNNWKGPKKKTKLSYKEQREYDALEGEIDALSNRSEQIDQEMIENATNSVKLSELQEEKVQVEAELEQKMERFFELEELVESFQ